MYLNLWIFFSKTKILDLMNNIGITHVFHYVGFAAEGLTGLYWHEQHSPPRSMIRTTSLPRIAIVLHFDV
jgi:hypothetical protein